MKWKWQSDLGTGKKEVRATFEEAGFVVITGRKITVYEFKLQFGGKRQKTNRMEKGQQGQRWVLCFVLFSVSWRDGEVGHREKRDDAKCGDSRGKIPQGRPPSG